MNNKIKLIMVLGVICLLVGIISIETIRASPGWPDTDFTKCKDITINNPGSTTLTDFPVYVNLTYDSDMNPDYSDLRFYSAGCGDGGSLLAYEIENYTDIKADIWVKTTLSPGDNVISVYYGNAGASSGENPTGVWDDNYVMVQHLQESGTGTRYDSTQYGNNGTPTSYDGDEDILGITGPADDLDGSNDYISGFVANILGDSFTFEQWVKPETFDGCSWGFCGIIGTMESSPSHSGCSMDMGTAKNLEMVTADAGAESRDGVTWLPPTGVWYYIVGTHESGNNSLYVNETFITSFDQSVSFPSENIKIGSFYTDYSCCYFNGIIDEVRISNTSRTADWINQSYTVVQWQNEYLTFGSEETYSPPIAEFIPTLQLKEGSHLKFETDGRMILKS